MVSLQTLRLAIDPTELPTKPAIVCGRVREPRIHPAGHRWGAGAVMVIEHHGGVISRAAQVVGATRRAVGLVLILFLLSLSGINVLLTYTTGLQGRPFQAGALTLVVLFSAVVLIISGTLQAHGPQRRGRL